MDVVAIVNNVVIMGIFGLAAYFGKCKLDTITDRTGDLADDVKQLRHDIFAASIANETHKASCQSMFVKQDAIIRIWDKLDRVETSVIKLEAHPHYRRHGDPHTVGI